MHDYVCMFDTIAQSVNASTESKCTITPMNPTNLTVSNGVLSLTYGMKNVRILCNCSAVSGTVLSLIRWFDPNGRLIEQRNKTYFNAPNYFTENFDNRSVVLVILTFNDSYDGVYSCGFGKKFPPKHSLNVDLTIGK